LSAPWIERCVLTGRRRLAPTSHPLSLPRFLI
jgi:hypothetical protein